MILWFWAALEARHTPCRLHARTVMVHGLLCVLRDPGLQPRVAVVTTCRAVGLGPSPRPRLHRKT
jgi:hypothetical protein